MRQAIHIFKKDVRQFRYLIALLLAWTTLFAFVGASPVISIAESLYRLPLFFTVVSQLSIFVLPAMWCFLIERVIHAEALPGDTQFWLTRPYSRRSLLLAKAIFVVAFINLPFLLAQAVLIVRAGLPLVPNVSGLIWQQAIVTATIILPAVALSAVTSTTPQFVAAAFLVGLGTLGVAIGTEHWDWVGLQWIKTAVEIAIAVGVALTMVWLQFTRRMTTAMRAAPAAGFAAMIGAGMMLPWSAAFTLQSDFGRSIQSSPRVELVRPMPRAPRDISTGQSVVLSARVRDLPDDSTVLLDGAEATIEGPGGDIWRSGLKGQNVPPSYLRETLTFGVHVPSDYLNQIAERPVHIHAVLYFTVLSNRPVKLPLDGRMVRLPARNACSATRVGLEPYRETEVACFTAFTERTPYLWFFDTATSWQVDISYAPFPMRPQINPVTLQRWSRAGDPELAQIVERIPIAHIRSEVDLRDVPLRDFAQ